MSRGVFKRIGDNFEESLRTRCESIAPEKRLYIVLTLFLLFASIAMYVFVSSIYSINTSDSPSINIEHISPIQLHDTDTINPTNN